MKFARIKAFMFSLTMTIPTWAADPVTNLPPENPPAVKQSIGQSAPAPAVAPVLVLPNADTVSVAREGFLFECAAARPNYFTPYMLGDFVGPLANLFSDVKIAEGESPRPIDRVFYKFNYYNNLEKSRWADPTQPIHSVSLVRNTFGFEKTFFNGQVSLGLRMPFNTIDAEAKEFQVAPDPVTGELVAVPGGPGISSTQFGNISAIAKAILLEDRQSGSLISGGVTISFPTASSRLINLGMSEVTYMQPFLGFIWNRGDFFVQGFSSITFPLVHAESIVMFNDLGVGYYIYRGNSGWLKAVAPTLEMHIEDPLHQADAKADLFGFFDTLKLHNVVDFTLGTTFEFANGATLAVGMATPVTGPKPFDFEVLAQVNFRF